VSSSCLTVDLFASLLIFVLDIHVVSGELIAFNEKGNVECLYQTSVD
jgi:hypothetical protein